MHFKKIAEEIVSELTRAGVKSSINYFATTGSIYVRFEYDKFRKYSIRIADHAGKKYTYTYELRSDIKLTGVDYIDNKQVYHYVVSEYKKMINDIIKRKEHTSIKSAVYSYFINEDEYQKYNSEDIYFGPSSISACRRQLYYKKTNTERSNPIDEHTYIKFKLGDVTHEAVQLIIKNQFEVLEIEEMKEFIAKGVKFKYAIDAIVRMQEQPVIIEIKSIYAGGAAQIKRAGSKKEHEIQLYMYMLFEKIQKGIIYYICRDSGFQYEFTYTLEELNKKYSEYIKNRLVELKCLEVDIVSETPPERDYNVCLKKLNGEIKQKFTKDKVLYKTDWQCSYCEYYDMCWSTEIKNFKDSKENYYFSGGK